MAWNTASVALGETTKKSHYDRLRQNDQTIASGTFTFYSQKTFSNAVKLTGGVTGTCTHRGKTTFSATAVFKSQKRNSSNEQLCNWIRVTNPPTGWMYTKTSGWTADTWVTVDISAYVTAGTKSIKIVVNVSTTSSKIYTRPYNDSNISSTPNASQEYSQLIARFADNYQEAVIDLSSDYKFDIAVENVNSDVYISYPRSELR